MKYLKLYLHQQHLLHQARRWLHAHDQRLVARCLWHLNRHARHCDYAHRAAIYTLKTSLIQSFYEQGYCIAARRQAQHLECWSCDGTGDYWGSGELDCYKCDGTGIYRTYYLICFVFNVHGRHYIWHQPEDLVAFPVTLSNTNTSEYHTDHQFNAASILPRPIRDLYIAVLYQYLRQHNAAPRGLYIRSLKQSLVQDWQNSRPANPLRAIACSKYKNHPTSTRSLTQIKRNSNQ
jgi:hypothetical protein